MEVGCREGVCCLTQAEKAPFVAAARQAQVSHLLERKRARLETEGPSSHSFDTAAIWGASSFELPIAPERFQAAALRKVEQPSDTDQVAFNRWGRTARQEFQRDIFVEGRGLARGRGSHIGPSLGANRLCLAGPLSL